jgi:hypothetical protein
MEVVSAAWAHDPTDRPSFKCVVGVLEAFRQRMPTRDGVFTKFTDSGGQLSNVASSMPLSGVKVLQNADSSRTIKEDSVTILENIAQSSSKKEKATAHLWYERLSSKKKYSIAVVFLLILLGITLGVIFVTKGSSSSSNGSNNSLTNSTTPTSSPGPKITGSLLESPLTGDNPIPIGLKNAPVAAGSYRLSSVDCTNYQGLSARNFVFDFMVYPWKQLQTQSLQI